MPACCGSDQHGASGMQAHTSALQTPLATGQLVHHRCRTSTRLAPASQAGITENLVFKHLHEDAEHLYNTTMSLHAVVTQLTDRSKRLARKVSRSDDEWQRSRVCLRWS